MLGIHVFMYLCIYICCLGEEVNKQKLNKFVHLVFRGRRAPFKHHSQAWMAQ
uniref:Uncharacterized protein n=1 Tax=Anguilla anguilla TaxID=7936 RepID=A0A0E9R9W2_ANGAN